jgi:hypothetical protein
MRSGVGVLAHIPSITGITARPYKAGARYAHPSRHVPSTSYSVRRSAGLYADRCAPYPPGAAFCLGQAALTASIGAPQWLS